MVKIYWNDPSSLTWEDVSTMGPTGPTGPMGAQGYVGPTGPPGEQGIQGESGQVGYIVGEFGQLRTPAELPADGFIPTDFDGVGRPPAGFAMPTGGYMVYLPAAGDTHPEYDDLYQYVREVPMWINVGKLQGPPGAQGPMGPQGWIGPTGPQGDLGPLGPTGPRGLAGVAGPMGVPGPTGPTGPEGVDGVAGPEGVPGPAGPEGPPGPHNISADPNNGAILGTDGLIWVPDEVVVSDVAPVKPEVDLWVDLTDQGGGDLYVDIAGDTMTGPLTVQADLFTNYLRSTYGAEMGGYTVTGVGDPVNPTDAANRKYTDTKWGAWTGLQEEYDAIPVKDEGTLYIIVEG